jgi:hypothetical protein
MTYADEKETRREVELWVLIMDLESVWEWVESDPFYQDWGK